MALRHRLKARAIRFRQAAPPVLIFGLRRGGSTMVADAVAGVPGVWFANEPFAVLPAHPAYQLKRRLLPQAPHSHFFGLDGPALAQFAAYARGLLGAEFPEIGTARVTRPVLRADRVCLKILNAPWMIGWFAAQTDARILSLVRHPAAQALSVLRQGWGMPVEAYAARPDALAARFSGPEIERIGAVLAAGDPWEVALLDWVVTARPLIRDLPEGVELLRYEDIVADMEGFASATLAGRLGLADPAGMAARLGTPSNSSGMSLGATRDAIRQGAAQAITGRWQTEIDADQRRRGQALLEAFGVTLYSFAPARA